MRKWWKSEIHFHVLCMNEYCIKEKGSAGCASKNENSFYFLDDQNNINQCNKSGFDRQFDIGPFNNIKGISIHNEKLLDRRDLGTDERSVDKKDHHSKENIRHNNKRLDIIGLINYFPRSWWPVRFPRLSMSPLSLTRDKRRSDCSGICSSGGSWLDP